MRNENNNEGDISTRQENQPCTLTAITTNFIHFLQSLVGPMLNIWELAGGARQYETCYFNLDLTYSRTHFLILI
jgi:hypothetical protein